MKRLALLLLGACAAKEPPAVVAPIATPEVAQPTPVVVNEWATVTSSRPSDGCADPALARAAEKLLATPEAEVEPLLRMFGSPAVRPRVVTIHGDAAKAQVARKPETRCGEATSGDTTVRVLADFLADLEPLPTRARTGEWLSFHAQMLAPASAAKLVVLGERGIPKSFPTTFEQGRVRARFPLDQPGRFTVQLVATIAGGPRPVLEATVFADTTPTLAEPAAPGEDLPSLDKMIARVRKDEGLSPLKRDLRLDELAKKHAEAMAAKKLLAHDVGDGDFAERFQAQGFAATTVGENVAHAKTLALGHRALWASPSHRSNLLDAQYTRYGFAVVDDDSDHLWICEVFTSEMH